MACVYLSSGAFAIAALGFPGCAPPSSPAAPAASASKPEAPSKVSAPVKEADLATVTLTSEAEKRLGIALAAVERKPVPRTAVYAGIVEVPPGGLITVASPFNGSLSVPKGGDFPTPGQPVKQGQAVFTLVPILAPEAIVQLAPALIQAEGQVKTFTEQLKQAKITLERAENLQKEHLGGRAQVEDAQAAYYVAEAQLRAAERNRDILAQANNANGQFNAQDIISPINGVIQSLPAQPGQRVPAAAPLFIVQILDPVWVRVPIYVGDLAKLASDRDAEIRGVADVPGAPARRGRPIAAPPSGDPLNATVNIFYRAENKDSSLRTGERVGVTVPLKGEDENLTVPLAALVRDIHGNAWVYTKTGDHAYSRRLLMVDRTVGDLAIVASGKIKPGDQVVTTGAAELFGAEFGGFK
jgi:RND family efflux transporter MFP subunit